MDNTNPNVDGNLVSYNHFDGTISTVHTYDLSSGTDATIPNSGSFDFLSDVNAGRVVFTSVTPSASDIALYDTTASSPAVMILDNPGGSVHRRDARIGGNNVVWDEQDPVTGASQIVVYNLTTGTTTQLTNATVLNEQPNISPDGTVVTWANCQTISTPCSIDDAVYSGGSWVSHVITTNGNCSYPDTNGIVVVYACDRGTGNHVYFQPVGGGAEQAIAFDGNEETPSVAGNFIAFAGLPSGTLYHQMYVAELTHGANPTWDGNLYQLTNNGAADVQLNDITQEADGSLTVVWQQQEANEVVYGFNFMPESPQEQISGLANTIIAMGLPHGLTTSLLAKLNAAQADFQAGSTALVCSDLQALINEANAQSGKGLTSGPTGQATQIINAATTIRQSLGC